MFFLILANLVFEVCLFIITHRRKCGFHFSQMVDLHWKLMFETNTHCVGLPLPEASDVVASWMKKTNQGSLVASLLPWNHMWMGKKNTDKSTGQKPSSLAGCFVTAHIHTWEIFFIIRVMLWCDPREIKGIMTCVISSSTSGQILPGRGTEIRFTLLYLGFRPFLLMSWAKKPVVQLVGEMLYLRGPQPLV